eukprot:g5089.t1 g5089   contig18:613781-614791(-)
MLQFSFIAKFALLLVTCIIRDVQSFRAPTLLPSRHHRGRPSTSRAITSSNVDVNINIPIIYENDQLLAVCKPPHISHHDDPASNQLGLLSLIRLQQQQQDESSFLYPHRLHGVHRLDRVTSGVLLLAKDSSVANELITKFRQGEVSKYYMAISGKKPKKKKQGWVKGQMVMGRRGSYKLVNENRDVLDEGDGDDEVEDGGEVSQVKKKGGYAVTRFYTAGLGDLQLAPLPKCDGDESNDDELLIPKTAILFQPHTGKTHQLRVAAKSAGIPILGDVRYGGGTVTQREENANFDRTYLHASAIHFQLNDEDVTIWSPPPFDHLFLPRQSKWTMMNQT